MRQLLIWEMNVECHHCSALHWMDEHIRKFSPSNPEFGMCCQHGKVVLPPAQHPPDELYHLFVDETMQAQNFHNNIVQYNLAFAFISLGVQMDPFLCSHGPPIFCIHGQLKHKIGSLLPIEGHSPTYAQLYIQDPLAAVDYHMAKNPNLHQDTMQLLQDVISHNDSYAGLYLHTYEILEHYNAPNYSLHLHIAPGQSIHTHNLPTVDEVAVIIPNENTYHDHHDIVLTLCDQEGNYHPVLQCISEGHTAYGPLQYVLLFPFGEPGWHWDMTLTSGKHMSLCQYMSYHLYSQASEFSTILHSYHLLQYYTVDMFTAIDAGHL
ncbi:hypothetical protein CPB84DRAFT_1884462 [Gymnopilus junonius]|uniref:Helitron helicase-like domain-containing protein n=1 Tax=Gymnopilus junonius TaxID=109634 RepID=A0A9P5NAN0_GYMJU|nr:hypothetical protein CPB84DRAFT_1884462 [Gymnopilus junonius]